MFFVFRTWSLRRDGIFYLAYGVIFAPWGNAHCGYIVGGVSVVHTLPPKHLPALLVVVYWWGNIYVEPTDKVFPILQPGEILCGKCLELVHKFRGKPIHSALELYLYLLIRFSLVVTVCLEPFPPVQGKNRASAVGDHQHRVTVHNKTTIVHLNGIPHIKGEHKFVILRLLGDELVVCA